MSYKAPTKEMQKEARNVGYIAITVDPSWAHKLDFNFIPFRASYRPVEKETVSLEVARFYLTVTKGDCRFESVILSKEVCKDGKVAQTLFLGLLVEAMVRWWRNFATDSKRLTIESTNPDIAEILLENGFDISNSGNQHKGIKHVQTASKGKTESNAGSWEN